ncbi:MAG: hypothetical protein ACJAU6_002253 [Alphaproteobacteria bacterium]|jgi:hypothetical protein
MNRALLLAHCCIAKFISEIYISFSYIEPYEAKYTKPEMFDADR